MFKYGKYDFSNYSSFFFYFQVDKQEFKHTNQLKPYFKSS